MATTTHVAAELPVCPTFIGAERRASRGRTEVLRNPATGEAVALVPYCTPEEVRAAVDAAQNAFDSWRRTPVVQRCKVLFAFHQLLLERAEELAALVTEENGKTLEEARASVERGIESVEFACGAPSLLMGETVPGVGTNVDAYSVREPLGVCVGIPPFNFPAMVPMWMFPLAIACGNAFVLKPSDKVPRSAVRLVELLYEAGLPAGVMNVVHGAKEVVDALIADPRVKAVSFVGSSAVAKYVYETASAKGKRVQALGGAKNHLVVMPDCDLKAAAKAIAAAAFGCAGERCLATSVVVAVGEAGDRLVDELGQAVDQITPGPGTDARCSMGPVITAEHRQRILSYLNIGEKEGAVLVRDGRGDSESGGYFLRPSIFDRVRPEMRIAREEIFGPVLSVIRARDLSEAIQVINRSDYGNAAAIFTNSGYAAREFTSTVQAGMVGVNVGVPAPLSFFPFAGWRGSFFGDLHALGKDGVRFYTETRVVTTRWPEPSRQAYKPSF